ncbi:hypothetical protein Tco_0857670 [Tanacetum coccineum]|uniref:Uncharacterized protein n=1 Tax=Tanacetum coccineum TaxID=301880 RepID=A0ABQ5B7Z0_9ASTR
MVANTKTEINHQKSRNLALSKSICDTQRRYSELKVHVHLSNPKKGRTPVWLLKKTESEKPGLQEFSSDALSQLLLIITFSELGMHDHKPNDLSSSKLVQKLFPLADNTATSR